MSMIKDILVLLLLLSGVILITIGITTNKIGRFKGWVGILFGVFFLGVAFWMG